jgi:hypothetical protein
MHLQTIVNTFNQRNDQMEKIENLRKEYLMKNLYDNLFSVYFYQPIIWSSKKRIKT